MPDQTPVARTDQAVSIGETMVGEVLLTPSGDMVSRGDDLTAAAAALHNAARLVDDAADNPLSADTVTPDMRRGLLARLMEALALSAVNADPPEGFTELQVLQLRSTAVTLLAAVIDAAPDDEADLLKASFELYCAVLEAETHPVLSDSMVFALYRLKNDLPDAMRKQAEQYMNRLAPLSPPCDAWFADGNRTIKAAWACGQGSEGFYRGTVAMLKDKGFEPQNDERNGGPCTYTKAYTDRKGEQYTLAVRCTTNHNSIFAEMDREDIHLVGYDGHSDLGRNTPRSLARGKVQKGEKLIFLGLCAGKDSLNRVREKYPKAQVITTFTSSYFRTKEVDGRKQMSMSENFNVLMVLLEDICERRPWTVINRNIRDDAVLFSYHHVMPGGTNYISPVHTLIRRRVLDTDHDGQSDLLDRLVDFNLFSVDEDTAREFEPRDPGVPAAKLDGTRAMMAAMALDTGTGYNQVTQVYRRGNLHCAGYFDPQDGDVTPVTFTRVRGDDGDRHWEMRVNAHYAHMTVEALRAVANYQFIAAITPWDMRLEGADAKLMGLVYAAFSLLYDEGIYSRDDQIWEGLLKMMHLPASIPYRPIKTLLWDEHHYYSGSLSHVRTWKEEISDEALAELEKD